MTMGFSGCLYDDPTGMDDEPSSGADAARCTHSLGDDLQVHWAQGTVRSIANAEAAATTVGLHFAWLAIDGATDKPYGLSLPPAGGAGP